MYNGEIINKGGRVFRVDLESDTEHGSPWVDDCGCGIVSEWTTRDKRPGERVLASDRSSKRYYDYQATIAKAKVDGWGLSDDPLYQLRLKLGRTPTKGEITAAAVDRDFDRLRGWCDDQWCYIGVCVTDITDDKDAPIDYSYSVLGIESDCDDYIDEVANDFVDEILRTIEAGRLVDRINDRFADAMACGV